MGDSRFVKNPQPPLLSSFHHDERVAGLVIEERRIRFAEFRVLKPGDSQKRTADEGAVFLPEDVIREGILAQPEILTNAVSELLQRGMPKPLTARKVILSVPVVRLVGGTVVVPSTVRPKEIDAAIRLAAERMIPFPFDEAYVDWQEIPSVVTLPEGGKKNQETQNQTFLFVAVRRIEIDPYCKAIEAAGVRVVAVEPVALSIARGLFKRVGTTYVVLVTSDSLLAAAMDGANNVRFFHHRSIPTFSSSMTSEKEAKDRAQTILAEFTSFVRFCRSEVGDTRQEVLVDGILDEASQRAFHRASLALGLTMQILYAGHGLSAAAARGAALRGALPRSDDHLISLMRQGTEAAYAATQATFLFRMASRFAVLALLAAVGIFGGTLGMLTVVEQTQHHSLSQRNRIPASAQETLQEAKALNATVQRARAVIQLPSVPHAVPSELVSSIPPNTTLQRVTLSVHDSGTNAELSVLGRSAQDILALRTILVEHFCATPIDVPSDIFFQPTPISYIFICTLTTS